jgi:hypothetical protein
MVQLKSYALFISFCENDLIVSFLVVVSMSRKWTRQRLPVPTETG